MFCHWDVSMRIVAVAPPRHRYSRPCRDGLSSVEISASFKKGRKRGKKVHLSNGFIIFIFEFFEFIISIFQTGRSCWWFTFWNDLYKGLTCFDRIEFIALVSRHPLESRSYSVIAPICQSASCLLLNKFTHLDRKNSLINLRRVYRFRIWKYLSVSVTFTFLDLVSKRVQILHCKM